MNSKTVRGQDMLRRVRDFATAETAAFPPATIGGQIFAEIISNLEHLEGHATSQVAGSNVAREGTEQKAIAGEELLEMLMMIRRTSRSLDHTFPGVHTKFRVPPHLSASELMAVADHFVTEATPLKTNFIAYGLPANFLDDLNDQIDEVRGALGDQDAGTRMRVTATAGISETLEAAFASVRRVDPIVRNVFRDQPAKLAAWASARHLEHAPKRKKPGGGGPGTPPSP
jgi:hypothetical protein